MSIPSKLKNSNPGVKPGIRYQNDNERYPFWTPIQILFCFFWRQRVGSGIPETKLLNFPFHP